jgi:hypothetical protein
MVDGEIEKIYTGLAQQNQTIKKTQKKRIKNKKTST